MSRLALDMEDLLSDMQSLKMSALSHAARVSPLVKGRTLGPDRPRQDEPPTTTTTRPHNVSFHAAENDPNLRNISSGSDNSSTRNLPNLKITVSNRAQEGSVSSSRRVDIAEISSVVPLKVQQQEQERKRKSDVRKQLEERQARIREADRLRDIQYSERMREAESAVARKVQERERQLLEAIEQEERIAEEFVERRKAEVEAENRRLEEIADQLKRKQEEMRKKHEMFDAIRAHQASFRKMTDVFTKTLLNIDKEFSAHFTNQKKTVQGLVKSFELLLQGVNTNREVTQPDVDRAAEFCAAMDQTNTEVVDVINRIQKEIADRLKKEQEQAEAVKLQQAAAEATAAPPPPPPEASADTVDKTAPQPSTSSAAQQHPLAAFVSQESLAFYLEIKTFYEQHQAAVKALLDDVSMKTYRFNCQKVINTPVNAISAVSREHFVDKFNKLDALLAGQPVKIGDTAVVSINGHPLGRTYCTMLIAKKFVSQADTMISSNAPAAFPIAAIAVALWQKYPDFGRFFLAYLHKECPYLVPYYLPQLEGQSQEDYLRSIGYRFSDGVLEKQDQYLKRMTGLARLYAAVVVASPRRGEQAPHPHGLEAGWRWLCNMLNLCPLPDICATLIGEFLQMAGAVLWANYGKQFVKVLRTIQERYLVELRKVDEGGPKARLEGLMEKITAEGRIPRPEGLLAADFW